jgi:DNA-binding NtrC family response regulator
LPFDDEQVVKVADFAPMLAAVGNGAGTGIAMYLRPSPPGQKRIVVMEHDQPILSRLCRLLQAKGYLTVGVDSASAACRLVHRVRVDLVLTTIALPEPERSAWAAALGRLDAGVPVIAMCEASSVHALDLFDGANDFGATAVLRRPFAATTLLQMITELVPSPKQGEAETSTPHSVHADWLGLVSGSRAIH